MPLSSFLRYIPASAVALAAAPILFSDATAAPTRAPDVKACEVVFTPEDSGFKVIRGLLEKATKSVYVSAYHFKSQYVADMLIDAARRDVKVAVVLDANNLDSKKHQAGYADRNGIQVYVDDRHHSHHSKYMIIDGRYVQTGSFNYNDHAEYDNSENLLVIESRTLAAAYVADWEKHRAHAVPYRSLMNKRED